MTPTVPLRVPCPRCASFDVVYSCEPHCCFNHVCGGCRCTFQTATEAVGGKLQDLVAPEPQDSTDATAPCCECKSIAVHALEDGRAVCVRCGSLLVVQYEDIAPT